MKYGEKFIFSGFLIGGLLGFIAGKILFENIYFSFITTIIFGIFFSKQFIEYFKKKRKRKFLNQFCDFLDSISTSLSCGKNSYYAFLNADMEMQALFNVNEPICVVTKEIVKGMEEGKTIEELLYNIAEESGCQEVKTFAMIYSIGVQTGGNLKEIVDKSRNTIVDKIMLEDEIETMLIAPKNELNIMMVMPLIMVSMLKVTGNTETMNKEISIIVNLIAFSMFMISYIIGRKMVDIEI